MSLARRADCVIEMIPQVGDHVAAGDNQVVARLRMGRAAPPQQNKSPHRLF